MVRFSVDYENESFHNSVLIMKMNHFHNSLLIMKMNHFHNSLLIMKMNHFHNSLLIMKMNQFHNSVLIMKMNHFHNSVLIMKMNHFHNSVLILKMNHFYMLCVCRLSKHYTTSKSDMELSTGVRLFKIYRCHCFLNTQCTTRKWGGGGDTKQGKGRVYHEAGGRGVGSYSLFIMRHSLTLLYHFGDMLQTVLLCQSETG